jgi:phage terminase small subunit
MSKLTDKQRLFVAEYLVDLNATQAAIRAGYSEKTARQQGQRLLTNVDIRRAIEEAEAERLERLGVRAERVLEELARLGFSNMLDYLNISRDGEPYVDLSEMTREQAAAVQEVIVEDFLDGRGEDAREVRRVKFKLADKKAPLELLGKHLKLFTEKHEHTGAGGGPIEIVEVAGSDDGDPGEEGPTWP